MPISSSRSGSAAVSALRLYVVAVEYRAIPCYPPPLLLSLLLPTCPPPLAGGLVGAQISRTMLRIQQEAVTFVTELIDYAITTNQQMACAAPRPRPASLCSLVLVLAPLPCPTRGHR